MRFWTAVWMAALALGLSDCQDRAGAISRELYPDGRPAPESAGVERGNSVIQEWTARLQYAPTVAASPAPASLRVPVGGLTRAAVLARVKGSDRAKNPGLVLSAPRNTPVLAAAGGLVTQAGSDPAGGRVVTVWGPGDRRYYYAHLQDFAPNLTVGRPVRAGDRLGTVGDSGSPGLTRLYFAVFGLSGKPVDPLPLLRDAPGR